MGKVQHVPGEACTSGTAQTSGMTRLAALSGETVGSRAIWMGETHVAQRVRRGRITMARVRRGSTWSRAIRSSSIQKAENLPEL
jgi:uncharacterized RmlC-like cupin family protein